MKSKGFTLIELLVVISIIGILGAVVIPLLGSDAGLSNQPGTSCRAGYLFETRHNRQVIAENGGGIPCGKQVQPGQVTAQ